MTWFDSKDYAKYVDFKNYKYSFQWSPAPNQPLCYSTCRDIFSQFTKCTFSFSYVPQNENHDTDVVVSQGLDGSDDSMAKAGSSKSQCGEAVFKIEDGAQPPPSQPQPSSSPPQPAPPAPAQPSRALGVVVDFKDPTLGKQTELEWHFMDLSYGEKADCKPGVKTVKTPPGPINTEPNFLYRPAGLSFGGTVSLDLNGRKCEYKNSGGNEGKLFCGDRTIDCKVDPGVKVPLKIGEYPCRGVLRTPMYTCPY